MVFSCLPLGWIISRVLANYDHDPIETPVSVNTVLEEQEPCRVHTHGVGLHFYCLVLILIKLPTNAASLFSYSLVFFYMKFILQIFCFGIHL